MREIRNQTDKDMTAHYGMITGMFRDRKSTEDAYNALLERGYTNDEINLIMSGETRQKQFSGIVGGIETGTKEAEIARNGSAHGGTGGPIVSGIAAIGTSLVIPDLGIVLAGPVAAALAGAGAGGSTDGIIGTLVDSGIPVERAQSYKSGLETGNIIMGVHPRNDEDARYLENYWLTARGEEIHG